MIHESIVDPNAQIAKGYPANVMPATFGETLTPKELEDLVEYLVEETPGRRGREKKSEPASRRSPPFARKAAEKKPQQLHEVVTPTPGTLRQGDPGGPGGAGADRPHRRRGAPDRLGPGLPGLAQVLRPDGPAARDPRGHRVLQPPHHRPRRRWRRSLRSALAFFRQPYRWHLALFGALLPLGVLGQAILGALVVKYHLAPGLVMSHFILSMLLLDAAFALAWFSRHEPWERRRSTATGSASGRCGRSCPSASSRSCWGRSRPPPARTRASTRARSSTASKFEGTETLQWVVQRHVAIATVFGLAAIGVWFLLRRPGGDRRAPRRRSSPSSP